MLNNYFKGLCQHILVRSEVLGNSVLIEIEELPNILKNEREDNKKREGFTS
jgi:hypothetical protein